MTTVTESFNKADSDTLGPDLSWTETEGDIDVVSNRASAAGGADSFARADSDLATSNHYAQIVVTTCAGSNAVGACARFDSAENTCYVAYMFNNNTLAIEKQVAGTRTSLSASASITSSLPELYRLEANGSSLKAFQAGVERVSTTDSSITTGVRAGIFTFGAAATGDDFEAKDLGAVPSGARIMFRGS